MLVYNSTKENFMYEVDLDSITDRILAAYKLHFGNTGKPQIRSWTNSMQYMYKVLNDKDIPADAGVSIEFNIPSTSKRVDFILTGLDEEKKDSVIIIELKQWEEASKIDGKDGLVSTYTGGATREVTHPSYQAYSYAALLEDFNYTVQKDKIDLYPCAYLHNYVVKENDDLLDDIYHEYLDEAPMFGKGDVLNLRNFIKKYVKYGDNSDIMYRIDNGKLRPSKRLQDTLSSMLKGNKEFLMIDDQKVVFELALSLAKQSAKDNKKRVLLVNGGPGTGKSVLAINLLVDLIKRGMVVNYVTKNSAPREVFYSKLKGEFKANYIKNLFKGSGIFTESGKNEFDCLIIDEAHRLNAKSGMFQNLGENQIKEIIHASKLSIFFLDENQQVTTKDIGTNDEVKKWAKQQNAELTSVGLCSQFRCNGSDGYLAWLDNLLDIRETANYYLDFDYDFKVFDNPNEMRQAILEKNKVNNKSRIVAGYCWDWIKEGKNNSEVHDIVIDDFEMSWNLGNSKTWAIDASSVDEAGCIHTCQGLEFDYVGVIIGDDLKYKDGVVTDFMARASTDQSIKGMKSRYKTHPDEVKEQADKIIKNTYRTLMTRGMKGCYIYCTNKELSNYIKSRL